MKIRVHSQSRWQYLPLAAAWLFACAGDDNMMQNPQATPGAGTTAPAAGSTGAAGRSAAAGSTSMPAAGSGGRSTAGGVAGTSAGTAGRTAQAGTSAAAGSAAGGTTASAGSSAAGSSAAAGSGAGTGAGGTTAAAGTGAGGSSAGTGAAGGGAATGATFTEVYTAIMAGCTCHTSPQGRGGLIMNTKAAAYTNLVGASGVASGCTAEKRVVASDPTKSMLYVAASGGGMIGSCRVPKMPPQGMLSTADADKIKSWIMAGAMNN